MGWNWREAGKYVLLTEAKMLVMLFARGRIPGAVLCDRLPVIILVGGCGNVPPEAGMEIGRE